MPTTALPPTPPALDFRAAESAAAALARGLGPQGVTWPELVQSARATVDAEVAAILAAPDITPWHEEQRALPLIAAGRILDAASWPASRLPADLRAGLAVDAALVMATWGNAVAAETVLRRVLPTLAPDPAFAALIATAAPNLLDRVCPWTDTAPEHRTYLDALTDLLATGSEVALTEASAHLSALTSAAPPDLGRLFTWAAAVLRQIAALAVARVLPAAGLPPAWTERLLKTGVRLLLPPQRRALLAGAVTGPGNHVLALAAGAGKTLLAETALIAALDERPGLAVLLVPYVALGNQVAAGLQRRLPAGYRLHRLLGGYRNTDTLDPAEHAEVVVATTERLDALLRTTPGLLPHLRVVVVDEAHTVDAGVRGARLEGLIARLRLLQIDGHPLRLLLMSAAADPASLLRWLGAPTDAAIADPWRPAARRLATWLPDGALTWHAADDPFRLPEAGPETPVGGTTLPWPETDFRPTDAWALRQKQEGRMQRNVAALVTELRRRQAAPVLLVCASKSGARGVAAAVAARYAPIERPAPELTTLISRIEEAYPFLNPLAELLRQGIAFHHAALPFEVRRGIEDAARARALRAVAATTTLAEGIDLPFRWTVLVDWLRWEGDARRPIPAPLLRNIAGRCGRPGAFVEGDTIVIANPVDLPSGSTADDATAVLHNLLFDERSHTPRGALLGASEPWETHAALSTWMLAALAEHPSSPDLPARLAAATLTGTRSAKASAKLTTRITDALAQLVALGMAAHTDTGPALTERGRAALLTGFSPESCAALLNFLSAPQPFTDRESVLAALLRDAAPLPEQPERRIGGEGPCRFPVKPEDYESVIGARLAGTPITAIFTALPAVARSTREPDAAAWLRGERGRSEWDSVYEAVLGFIGGVIDDFLPWAVRACALLAPVAGSWAADLPWREWADDLEAVALPDDPAM